MDTPSLLARRQRVLGPAAPLFYDRPLHIVHGTGVWLYDADGRQYLDAYNNVPVVGHAHPRVVDAIALQTVRLNVHTRYLHENIVRYAERLTATFDGLDMAVFTCTGSEANDLALRMARTLTGREGILCTNNTYHGNSAAVDELSTTFTGGRTGSARVRAVPYPDTYRPLHGLQGAALTQAYVQAVRVEIEQLERSGHGLAGLLMCPIFANEGLPDVAAGYLEQVVELVHAAGGLVIFDEVQAGFGRTGRMWGHLGTAAVPDIVTLGKPMGNGYPIAGVVSRSDIINPFRERVMHFNTFAGNPVACAAATAVLDVIEEDGLLGHVQRIGPQLADGLRQLMNEHEGIGDVRARGLFFAVELVSDRTAKTPDAARAKAVVNHLREHGGVLISRAGAQDNVLKIRPPLPFAEPHLVRLLDALHNGLLETRVA